ncbi:MAG: nucleoside monophosphate kinase [Rickettsiales bacterium]|jgi:adenylate kinase|nr:nucleoside monophosphate kinase [Rickettsiales bacterium]
MPKNMIVIMGGQGSGKGTQAAILRENHNYNYIETGAIFRGLPTDSEIAKLIARGELVPDEKLFPLVSGKIAAGGDADVLFDGFPRTLPQAKWLYDFARQDYKMTVIYFDLPEKVMIERINNRLKTGGGRADDSDMAAVRKRLNSFQTKTMPAIKFFQNATGIRFLDIDATGTVEQIAKEIKARLR